jgi:hypothetical protein
MLNTKRLFSFMLTAFFIASAISAPLAAQDTGGTAPKQASLNLMVFRGIYGADGLAIRKKTMESINTAIEQGNTSDEIYDALEYLSMEGIKNRTMERGQLLNDYPTVRRDVATELGKIGTEKAADILIQVCRNETAFDAQREAINALGNIGINDNGKTIDAILTIPKLRSYDVQSTTDIDFERLVSSAIVAFDKIDKNNDGIGNRSQKVHEFLGGISKKHFPKRGDLVPIHERAKHVLEDILRREAERR